MKSLVIGAALAVLAAAGMVLIARADAATVPAYHPIRLTHVGDARQLVVVASPAGR